MASHDQTLRAVVAAHEKFFGNLLANSRAQLMVTAWQWIGAEWVPWFTKWEEITADGDPLPDHLVSAVSKSLSELRERARENNVPLPELSPYAAPADHMAHLGYPRSGPADEPITHILATAPGTAPPPGSAPNSAAALPTEIARETDRRFREETGWPEGRKIDPHRESSMLRRWLQIRYEVAQEIAAAQG